MSRLLDTSGPNSLISVASEQNQQDGLVAAFVRLANSSKTSGPFIILGLGQLQSHVLAQASRAGGYIAQIAVFFSLLALLVAFIVSRALIRPLRNMTEAVELFSPRNGRSASCRLDKTSWVYWRAVSVR